MSAKEVWMNKKNGDLFLVVPYYDPIGEMPSLGLNILKDICKEDPLLSQAIAQGDDFLSQTKNMLCYHAGYLFENEHGAYFLLPKKIESEFERLDYL